MIVEYDYSDLCSLLGFRMDERELLDALSMYGTPPEGLGKVEVFPNRPDMLSVEGVTRSLKGFIGMETGMKRYPVFRSGISVVVDDLALRGIRPFCSFAVVDGVVLDDFSLASMMQLQEKLHMTHGRRRKKASIGIYDLGTVTPPLKYTAIEPRGIEFVPLDSSGTMSAEQILTSHPRGREYSQLLDGLPKYPVLVDSKGRVLSMPPIINSEDAKVTPATRSIFIDATGWDQTAVDEAVRIMATSIAERFPKSRIGTVDGGNGRVTPEMALRTMSLDVGYCNRLLGITLPAEKMAECLRKMRFDASIIPGDKIQVAIPPYRTDIMHPIDLVEDVAIAFGYGNFSPSIPAMPNVGCELPDSAFSSSVRTTLVGLGFTEAFTFALSNRKKLFGNMMMDASQRKVAEIANPKTTDFTVVRDAILPGLMEVLGYNAHQPYPQKLFELGEVVNVSDGGEARNGMALSGVIAHSQASYSEVKSVVEAICRMTGIKFSAEPSMSDAPWFIRGRRASICEKGIVVGDFGELHPQALENWGIGVPVTAFELKFI